MGDIASVLVTPTAGQADAWAEDWESRADALRAIFAKDPLWGAIQADEGCVDLVCTHPADGNCPCGNKYMMLVAISRVERK